MNFARTNLSLLLARQNRQATQQGGDSTCRVAPPCVARANWARANWVRAEVAMPRVQAAAPVARARSAGQILELVGALAMMAAFMVLALFG